jgi:hypothetical protein
MQYLLMLHFPPGKGPQEARPSSTPRCGGGAS